MPLAARIRFMNDTPESPNPSVKDGPPSAAPIAVPPGVTGALVLADGSVFWGKGLGASGRAVGEVCFNTSMTGYQEIATDPSYAGERSEEHTSELQSLMRISYAVFCL